MGQFCTLFIVIAHDFIVFAHEKPNDVFSLFRVTQCFSW